MGVFGSSEVVSLFVVSFSLEVFARFGFLSGLCLSDAIEKNDGNGVVGVQLSYETHMD